MRRWIESQSGAIGTEAPEGSLLNVFLLRFFDARSFKLDSRQRVAVLVTLVDRHGRAHQSLEQSDLWVCAGECDLFPLPEGAVPMDESMPRSEDAHRLLYTKEGGQQLAEDGFLGMASPLHYVLLHHALENLEASLTGAVARR